MITTPARLLHHGLTCTMLLLHFSQTMLFSSTRQLQKAQVNLAHNMTLESVLLSVFRLSCRLPRNKTHQFVPCANL